MPGNKNSGGHNRKGAQLHALNGTFRKDRHADSEAPEPPIGKPDPPGALNAVARGEWDRMIGRLELSKTISRVDDAALYQYAKLFAETESTERDAEDARQLSKQLKRLAQKLNGSELVDAIGKIVELQKIVASTTTKLRQQRMAIRQYLVEFGMTPSSRSRVKVEKVKAPGDSQRARFFGLPGGKS